MLGFTMPHGLDDVIFQPALFLESLLLYGMIYTFMYRPI